MPSLGSTTGVPSSFPPGRTHSRGPGPLLPRRPRRLSLGGENETSQVPGQPLRTCPALGPRRTTCTRPLRCKQYCLPLTYRRRLRANNTHEALSRGLHAPCVRFAAGVTPRPRNTRFRLVANLYRVRTLTCWVAQGGFSYACFLLTHIIPLPQALPGAISPCFTECLLEL